MAELYKNEAIPLSYITELTGEGETYNDLLCEMQTVAGVELSKTRSLLKIVRRSDESRVSGMVSISRGIQTDFTRFQRKINLTPQHRGVHLITEEIIDQIPEISQFSVGLCHIHILHTTASLAVNERWDPNVRYDMEMTLNKIVPEDLPYQHKSEGPDDMPAHVKACFLGSSITVPITDGKLNLGQWQGIWLCEHRNQAGSRKLMIALNGSSSSQGTEIGSTWFQRKINLRPQHRGVHLITEEIIKQIPEISQFSVGLCHIHIMHTTASLAINERWDPNVLHDMEMILNKIVPEDLSYRHSCDGPDDMPAHVKACFLGSSITIPITKGILNFNGWQSIWLGEHRNEAGSRKIVITLNGSSLSRGTEIGSTWFQHKINLTPQCRGVHLITEEIIKQIPEISQFSDGLCHIHILHTTASLAINERWDPNVRCDMEMMINKIVPENVFYRHSCEGPDDMPAHAKACFLGSSITVLITEGKLNLNRWQGIWLGEHRHGAGSRKLMITLNGSPNSSVSDMSSSS